ncbi:MAG: SRPBCC family protein, partial [Verrucomicrobiota bacterium]
RSVSGTQNAGAVNFHPRDEQHTIVTLRMEHEPEGALETIGSALGILSGRVEADLRHFKKFIQERSTETGSWRGEIHGSDVGGEGTSGRM